MINTLSVLDDCRASSGTHLSAFYTDCVEDSCAVGLQQLEQLCVSMEAVVAMCEEAGAPVSNIYRIETECSK